LGLFSKRTVA